MSLQRLLKRRLKNRSFSATPVFSQGNLRPVWYTLEGRRSTTISVPLTSNLDDFIKVVKVENDDILSQVKHAKLYVFETKDSFENYGEPLNSGLLISALGMDDDHALYLTVGVSGKTKWKSQTPVEYSIETGQMHFVNRDTTTEGLLDIQKSNYIRAVRGSGQDWVIPFADNIWGLGKTEFALQYISKCRETFPDESEQTEFQKTLCNSHTVHLVFKPGALADSKDKNDMDKVMIAYLREALRPLFITAPPVLDNHPKDACKFLEQLTEQAGPVFIVLDEIGHAFEADNLTLMQQREKFFDFTRNIISQWLTESNIFFLMLGRGAFLSHVPSYPDRSARLDPYILKRLDLHLLQPPFIKTIIEKTTKDKKTLKEYYELNDEQVSNVSEKLYQELNGHPRSLLTAFQKCKTYQELMDFSHLISSEGWIDFNDHVSRNKSVIKHKILDKINTDNPVNLCQMVRQGDQYIPLDHMINNSFISWSGKMNMALLRASPFVLELLRNSIYSVEDYIRKIASAEVVSIDHSVVLKWIFIKRFQDLFKEPCTPNSILPEFFTTKLFANKHISLSDRVVKIPKITSQSSPNVKTLDAPTAHPDSWKSLLSQMSRNCCYKPPANSASSEAIFRVPQASKTPLFIGLVVKNDDYFFKSHLEQECRLFNSMFSSMGQQEAVLIICSTKCGSDLRRRFVGNVYYFQDKKNYPFIDEIIVLNVSYASRLTEFLGLPFGKFTKTLKIALGKTETEEFDD